MRHIHRTSLGASGLIEFLIYNLPLPVSLTRWPGYVLIGIGQFAVYYVIFRTLVVKLNLKTPGREDDENVKLYSKAEYRQKVAQPQSVTDDIIRGLGGKENILSVDNCFTRLRVAVRDMARVDDTQLKIPAPTASYAIEMKFRLFMASKWDRYVPGLITG